MNHMRHEQARPAAPGRRASLDELMLLLHWQSYPPAQLPPRLVAGHDERYNLLGTAYAMGMAASRDEYFQQQETIASFVVTLSRIDSQYCLALSHHDRPPSIEEMLAVCEAAGAPIGIEPISAICTLTAQDGAYRRLHALVAAWTKVRRSASTI